MDEVKALEQSARLQQIPPYVFAKIDQIKKEELQKGRKLISLGIGDPDQPTPSWIIDKFVEAVRKPKNHSYPSYAGLLEFRKAAARWMHRRFGVELNPENEVLTLIGSKEGIAHLPLAFVNPGDATLVPDPAYPVYHTATLLAGGIPVPFSLTRENEFLPDLGELENKLKRSPRTRILFLNYPNNPTAAIAPRDFFKDVVKFAKKHQIIVCHDLAYSEIYFDGERPSSFLETPGALEIGCEFHSLSKSFNMTGWRVGFVAGHPKIIQALGKVKTNIDSGVFNAIQEAGMEALDHPEPFGTEMRTVYQRRRDLLIPALQAMGLQCELPKATFYVWCRVPPGQTSEEFTLRLIREKGIVCTPGNGFGQKGEDFIRFTLCLEDSLLKQVAESLMASV